MASILRFDNWQNSDGTSIATTDASGNISFAGAGAGKILQVVSTTKTDPFSTTSTSFADVPGVSVSITPTSATSKVFVIVTGLARISVANQAVRMNLVRDSTDIAQGTGGSSLNQTIYLVGDTNPKNYTATFLDSPATTSATTYRLQVASSGGGATVYLNETTATVGAISTITVMEVSA